MHQSRADAVEAQTKLAVAALVVPVFFVIVFAACIIGTYHQPHPHGIKLGVVGPPPQTAPVRAGLERVGGSAFVITPVASVPEAARAVRARDIDAAFVPTANPRQPATVIVASAAGRIVATGTESFLRAATASQGAQLAVRDVRPLPSGDVIGLGVFMFMIVCTICGYITPTILETAAPGLPPGRRYPMIAVVSVLVPALAYIVAGLGFDTYNGSAGTILAFIGVGALYTFTIGIGTRMFQVLLGPPGILFSLAIFVFLNIPSLGATYTASTLPGFWHFLNHFWVGAVTVDALRSILYFGGAGVGDDLLRLLAWTVAIAVILFLPVSRRLERRREQAPPIGTSPSPAAGFAGGATDAGAVA